MNLLLTHKENIEFVMVSLAAAKQYMEKPLKN